jgi:hypothetical protein
MAHFLSGRHAPPQSTSVSWGESITPFSHAHTPTAEQEPLPGHAGSAPAATQPAPVAAHCAHFPLQSSAQQTLLLQWLLWHSPGAEQAEPFGLSAGTH